MLEVNDRIRIPDEEFHWTFVRAGGPGGQNVNKVASKAVLRWDLAGSPSVPEDVKARLRTQQRRRVNAAGEFLLSSQRYRDQGHNVKDCRDKLRELLLQAAAAPRPRTPTRPTRSSRRARLETKRHRSAVKANRRRPPAE